MRTKILAFLATAARKSSNVSTTGYVLKDSVHVMNYACGGTKAFTNKQYAWRTIQCALHVSAFNRCWMVVPSAHELLHSLPNRVTTGAYNPQDTLNFVACDRFEPICNCEIFATPIIQIIVGSPWSYIGECIVRANKRL